MFRTIETRVLKKRLTDKPMVLATGGGVFVSQENRDHICAHATTIWLQASLGALIDRTKGRTNRPLLAGQEDRGAVLQKLLDERSPYYAQADIHVFTDQDSHSKLIESLIEQIETYDR